MIDPEHSPGPWTFEGPDEFGDYNIHEPGKRVAVAAVVSNLRQSHEVLYNARLVAAAPSMLQALLEFVSTFNTVPGSIGDEVKEDAFKAITKAVGRDPRS